MSSTKTRLLVLIACALLGLAVLTREAWLPIPFNSKFTEDRLLGKTYDEVIALCGKPSFDMTKNASWNVAQDGPHYMSYSGLFGETRIIYLDENRVVASVMDNIKHGRQ